jgi:hypothetical protein
MSYREQKTQEAKAKEAGMNATVYIITESCIRPSGAWAKTRGRRNTAKEAIKFACTIGFEGPGFGIIWSRTITVMKRRRTPNGTIREMIFERNL